MVAYGLSQLEYVPQGAALDRLCAAALARLPDFGSQATSNLLYALARLGHYPAALCSAAEAHAVSGIASYHPQARSEPAAIHKQTAAQPFAARNRSADIRGLSKGLTKPLLRPCRS